MIKLIKGTLGNVQTHIKAVQIVSEEISLSEKAQNIYNNSDGISLYRGYGFNDEMIYLADNSKCIIAEGIKDIEEYLLALAE